MSASAAVFFLMVVFSNGPISLTQIGDFKSKAECTAARDAVQKAAVQKPGIQFVCVSDKSLGDLEEANR